CYIEQLFPDVGLSSLELLEAVGAEVWVPDAVSCCGQPLINTGAVSAAAPLARGMHAVLAECDVLVCPSGSCAATLRQHGTRYGLVDYPAERIMELSQFLAGRLEVSELALEFPHRVALHQSCHGLRELGLGSMSELVLPLARRAESPARALLAGVPGLTLVEPERPDECCAFGGSFSIKEPEVSASMGNDRLADFERADAEVITSVDMSCLMHLSGLVDRQRRPLAVMHFSQI